MDNKKSILNCFFWKFGERITAQLVSLLVSIILARLLLPSDYGAVAMVMVFITIANVFVSSGLGSSLIQGKKIDDIDFSTVFWINLFLAIILYIILFISAPFIASFYNMAILAPVLRVLSIRIIVAAINSVQHAYVSRHLLFKKFFFSTLFGTILSGVVGIYLAYHGYGIWALVAQYMTNTITDTIVLWFTIDWKPMFVCSLERAKQLIPFGSRLLISALLDTGYNQLRSLVIGKVYTPSDLAYYNRGEHYPALITININSSISAVIFPAMAKEQEDKRRVKNMTRRAIQVSSFVMWPMMVGFAVLSEPLVKLVLTEKWLPCVPYIWVYCFTYALWPIHTANLQAMNAIGRSDWFLKLEVIKKIIGITSFILAIPYGPFAIAAVGIVTSMICTVVNSYPNKTLINYGFIEQIKDMLPSFLIAIVMGVLIYTLKFVIKKDIVLVVLQVLCGTAIYLVLSYMFNRDIIKYCFRLIHKKQ